MPPKSVPKLTKKQLDQQKKQQARLQKQKEQEQALAEKAKRQQQQRLREIERKKRSEEERVRIVLEKEKYHPILEQRVKAQTDSYNKLVQQQKWKAFTTPYVKNYSVEDPNLSTFTNLFINYKHKSPKETLAQCEQCQKYITKLQEKMLQYRADYSQQAEKQCAKSIEILHRQLLNKLEAVMIEFANGAQQMQERNVEQAKKKNEQNAAQKATKPIDNIFQMSDNFKLGMYINTISTKNYNKFNPISIKQFGFNSEVPPKWTNNTTIVKFEWVNFNHFGTANVRKEEFRIIGGVFNLQFYDMFVGTKKTNNIWIKKYYQGKEILDKFKLPSSAIKEPFRIMYEIPKYIFMVPYSKSTIKMAQFESSSGNWVIIPNQNITEYLEQEKRIILKVPKPDPVAFVQSKCADYPYIAWQLRTVQKGKILLDFELARTIPNKNGDNQQLMLQFEIGPNVIKLNLDTVWPEFKDLTQNYLTPEQMFWQLSKRGVHLLPVDGDYEFTNLKRKDRESEKNAIRDIAYAVEAFTIRSEPNESADVRVKMRENLDYENIFLQDQEKDWKRIRWGDSDKCWIDGKGVMQRHCNLQTLLQSHDFCEKECVQRMKFDNEFLLRKTVMKVLELTRLLAFTTSNANVKTRLVQILKEKIIVA